MKNSEDRSYKSYKPDKTYKNARAQEKTRIFAVAGNPVLHSMSPDMFTAVFEERTIDAVYIRIGASRVEDIMKSVKEMGITGINITSPFKEAVIPFLDRVEETARKIGAVNTVVMDRGTSKGYNTDAAGVVRAFLAADVKLSGRKAVVIGAGGAAKAALFGLLSEGAEVVILNRTLEKARELAKSYGCRAARFEDMDEEVEKADIVVSCISSSERTIKPHLLRKGLAILDANYSTETFLARDATESGCKVIDGREWLLFQGTEAFKLFAGIEPSLPVMRKALQEKQSLRKRNIAFVGFMGTGKSTVARSVSKRAGMPLIEIDREIEGQAGSSIREIFEDKGEDVFRGMERAEVAKIAHMSGAVISCGGGVVLDKRNRDILERNCIVVWLWTGIDSILKRTGDNGARPLLKGSRGESAVKELLDERLPLYARASDLVIRSEGAGPDEIARKVYEESRKFLEN